MCESQFVRTNKLSSPLFLPNSYTHPDFASSPFRRPHALTLLRQNPRCVREIILMRLLWLDLGRGMLPRLM